METISSYSGFVSVSDIRRKFYRVIRKPSKNVQEVINIEWREINLYKIRIRSIDEKVALYVG